MNIGGASAGTTESFQTASGGVDWSDERGFAVLRVMKGDSGGDGFLRRKKPMIRDAVGGQWPTRRRACERR